MRESPLYQEILEEGRQQEALRFVLRQLTRRLGGVESELQVRLQRLSIAQLEALGEALLDFSATQDLANWLQVHQ